MIWDVLDWIDKNKDKKYEYWDWPRYIDWHSETRAMMCCRREQKRKPIEEQSNECIDYIYSLLEA